jgi:hypothetical protein
MHYCNAELDDRSLLELSPLFDSSWYLARYPDVSASGMSPIVHYLKFGADEHRNPSAHFDTAWYVTTYPEARTARINPLIFHLRVGAAKGWLPGPAATLRLKTELPDAKILERFSELGMPTSATKFLRFGCQEFRSGSFNNAAREFKRAAQISPWQTDLFALYKLALYKINAEPIALFHEKFRDANVLVVHVSCTSRIAHAITSCNTFHDCCAEVSNIVVVGDSALEEDCYKFDTEQNVLRVPASDSYEALPIKVCKMLRFLGFTDLSLPVLKVDDDIHCSSLTTFKEHARGALRALDYAGQIFSSPSRFLDCRHWHFGKCSDQEQNFKPDGLLFLDSYVAGSYYWLSSHAVTLASKISIINERWFEVELFEDRALGIALSTFGIRPEHWNGIQEGALKEAATTAPR